MSVSRLLAATVLVLAVAPGCGDGRATSQAVAKSSKHIASAAELRHPVRELRTMVDDSTMGSGPNVFQYSGHWQHVLMHRDGRALGTSSRSYHDGDSASIQFSGTRIRVYGIVGKRGGYGDVAIDGAQQSTLANFYSPKVASALVYESPALASGKHVLTLKVQGRHPAESEGDYVNLDFAVISAKD